MKKLVSVLLAMVFFFSLANVALAETLTLTSAPAYSYKLENVKYDGTYVTGKVVPNGNTAAPEKIRVRVTFFLSGNIYMGTTYTADKDGNFTIMGVGEIKYITVLANAVNGENTTRLDAEEIFVP